MKINEIIQHCTPTMSKLYGECIAQVKTKLPDDVSHRLLCTGVLQYAPTLTNEESRISTRMSRLKALRENLSGMWLDSDMMLLKWFDFEFEKGYVYVAGDVGCSASAIFANGCIETIDFLISEFKNFCIHVVIDKNKDKFKVIPSGYLLHLRLYRLIKAGGGRNKNCEIEKENDDFKFKWINN